MSGVETGGRFGTGLLSRAAAQVYTLLVVESLLLVTTLPGLVVLVLLDRDASNVPLAVLCALPLGPAASAALYTLHHHRADLAELHPAAAFRRGYRANLGAVLRIWVPMLGWLAVIGVNLTYLDVADVPAWWGGLLVAVAVAVVLWGLNALVITSLFRFRTRDTARLAAYFLFRAPGVTLGALCLLVVAGGVTVFLSEAALMLAGSLLAAMLLRNHRPVSAEIRREFTA